MGMRATIAYIKTDKTVQLTSLQWSTRLDQTLGHMANSARENNQSPSVVIADLFKAVTSQWMHASAIEIDLGTDLTYDLSPGESVKINERDFYFGHSVQASFPQGEGNKTYNVKDIDIYNYHLDGGSIGAIYDERKPNYIEFFWTNPDTYEVETRKCSIDALANFYKDVENNPHKLKKFSFRSF